jgi:two-component system chemotaxis response regulator CheB
MTDLVVIGTSMGGLAALETLLPRLSPEFDLPVAVVQHRGVESTDRLSAILRRYTHLKVNEVHDKEPIRNCSLYLAPPDYHLLVERGTFALSTDPPIQHARPSIDVLFESAANAYGASVTAIVLTGAGRDGAAGAARVMARGGSVLVQCPETAECGSMPLAAIEFAGIDSSQVLPLQEIASRLNSLTKASNGKE